MKGNWIDNSRTVAGIHRESHLCYSKQNGILKGIVERVNLVGPFEVVKVEGKEKQVVYYVISLDVGKGIVESWL